MEFDSSSESALSSPESDHSDDSSANTRRKYSNEQQISSQVYGMMKSSSQPSSMSRSGSSNSRIKDYRKFSGNICPAFITGELAAAVRQSRHAASKGKGHEGKQAYEHSHTRAKDSKGHLCDEQHLRKEKNVTLDKNSFLIRTEGQTCSVLEVLDPSSDDENFVGSKSFLVKSDGSVSEQNKVLMKSKKSCIRNSTLSDQRHRRTVISDAEDYVASMHQLTASKAGRYRSQQNKNAPDLYDKSVKRLLGHPRVKDDLDHHRRRRSPRSMPNRCAKSDIEDLDGPDFEDIGVANLPENFRFSEPDLIKGTKEMAKSSNDVTKLKHLNSNNQSLESMLDMNKQSMSNIDRLSVSVSVASSANIEVQFPSVSSTSDSSVNSIGAILDSSSMYQASTPIKKKGFLLKLQTLKKRWPSRHKFTPNRKSQEITAEDFKETYMRSPGENKEERGGVESSDDRSECDRLSTVPRQRESVCSASSTSSNKQEGTNQKVLRRDNNDQLSITEVESLIREKAAKRPPVPKVHLISEVLTDIPPPLFPGNHETKNLHGSIPNAEKKEHLASSDISAQCSTIEDHGLMSSLSCSASKSDSMSRPASSASRTEFCPQIVTATVETVKAASAAAGFPLHKSSSLSTDLLSPDSLAAGRLSPAPSEISKTESALSPPSDVSKTESTRHLNQLEKIEEIKQVNASLMDEAADKNKMRSNDNSLLLVNSFEKTKGSDHAQSGEEGKELKVSLAREHISEPPKRVRIQKSEKPW